jgi:hypothetical protein
MTSLRHDGSLLIRCESIFCESSWTCVKLQGHPLTPAGLHDDHVLYEGSIKGC